MGSIPGALVFFSSEVFDSSRRRLEHVSQQMVGYVCWTRVDAMLKC